MSFLAFFMGNFYFFKCSVHLQGGARTYEIAAYAHSCPIFSSLKYVAASWLVKSVLLLKLKL